MHRMLNEFILSCWGVEPGQIVFPLIKVRMIGDPQDRSVVISQRCPSRQIVLMTFLLVATWQS